MEDFGVHLRLRGLKFSSMKCENLTCIHKHFLNFYSWATVDVSIVH